MCFSLESHVELCEHSASCVLHCPPAGALYPRPWLNNQYQRSNGVVMCQPNESLMTVICSPCWPTLVLIRTKNWGEFKSRTDLFFENGNVMWLFLRSVPINYIHSCGKAKKKNMIFFMYEEMRRDHFENNIHVSSLHKIKLSTNENWLSIHNQTQTI